MKYKDLIRANIAKNNPVINIHKHCFTYNHVPNDFRNIKIGKNKVLGLPMHEWFLKPLEFICGLVGKLPLIPQETKDTVINTRGFVDMIDKEMSMDIHEAGLAYEKNTIHCYHMMDLRLGCRGIMNKSIAEQGQELLAVREKYKDSVLAFWAVDPNQPDMQEKAIYALTVLQFDGIKIYPSEGYLPSHPELMKLFSYCETNDIPIVSHNSSANMHHPDWRYRILGRTQDNVAVDKTVTLGSEGDVATTYNDPKNWIPVLNVYPNLRLDIAHFGGSEWGKYLSLTIQRNWVTDVIKIITTYKNAYTDFSYTFSNKTYFDGLKTLLLSNPEASNKILFGSDYYMVFLEGGYGDMMKSWASLRPDLYDKLCRTNPKNFLNV
jgi:predicted TIM-barrel fold metal-dependent hydrolase